MRVRDQLAGSFFSFTLPQACLALLSDSARGLHIPRDLGGADPF